MELTAPAELVRGSADRIEAMLPVIATMRSQSHVPFTLDELAEMAYLSRFHFSRVFADVAGIPPGEFMTALRFERAKELLLTTDLSVTEICFETGYDSLGTFSARFSRLVGVSPAQFRRLPEIISQHPGLPAEPPLLIGPDVPAAAHVTGEMFGLHPDIGAIYLGLFPTAIARSRPVTGRLYTSPGPFLLSDLPVGQFQLLAAALPRHQTLLDHLRPDDQMLVAVGDTPVNVRTGHERVTSNLHFRPLQLTDPPILISLPVLALFSAGAL